MKIITAAEPHNHKSMPLLSDETVGDTDRFMHCTLYDLLATIDRGDGKKKGSMTLLYRTSYIKLSRE
jgi:hypothetical protein